MNKYTLSQLCWIKEVGLWRNNAMEDMTKLGISEDAIFAFCLSESFKNRDLIKLWYDYGGLYGAEFEKYFDFILQGEHFEEGCQPSSAPVKLPGVIFHIFRHDLHFIVIFVALLI